MMTPIESLTTGAQSGWHVVSLSVADYPRLWLVDGYDMQFGMFRPCTTRDSNVSLIESLS